MKISTFIVLLLTALVWAKDPVKVTLYATAEEPDADDYVQIEALVRQSDVSLPTALAKAAKIVATVTDQVIAFCGGKDRKKCQQSIEVSKAKISSNYQLFRKVQTFVDFAVEHEITIKVYKADQIGTLVDALQSNGIKKFDSFSWKGKEEVDEQATIIEAATERAQALCGAVNLKVNNVASIQRFIPQKKKEKKGEEGEADQDQLDQEDEIFKVEIECVEKKSSASKTKEDQL